MAAAGMAEAPGAASGADRSATMVSARIKKLAAIAALIRTAAGRSGVSATEVSSGELATVAGAVATALAQAHVAGDGLVATAVPACISGADVRVAVHLRLVLLTA